MKFNLYNIKNQAIGMVLGASMLCAAVPAAPVTVSAVEPINVTESDIDKKVNLTELGTLDWMHITATTNNEAVSKPIITRKKTSTPQIQFEQLSGNSGMLIQKASAVSYTWTDGESDGGSEYESMTDTVLGCVISYKNGNTATIGAIPEGTEVGCRITVPEYAADREFTFFAGGYSSVREIIVYDVEDDQTPLYTQTLTEANNKESTKKYTITIPADKGVVAEVRMKEKVNGYGNVFISGMALTDKGSALQSLIAKAESYDANLLSEDLKAELESAIAAARSAESEEDQESAMQTLQAVIDKVEESLQSDEPKFYVPNTVNWLYFGWENDNAKSVSTMGGCVYPGTANALRFKDAKAVCYTVTVDGKEYVPDETSADRTKNTKWYQADGYMNSPVSEWNAGETGIAVKIQHVPCRVLDDTATAVCSQVTLTNTTNSDIEAKLNVSVPTSLEMPLNSTPDVEEENYTIYNVTVPANNTVVRDFAAKAVGNITVEQLKSLGSFDEQYTATKTYYDNLIENLARPVSLPNDEVTNSYINSMIVMWETMVKVGNDYEMRGSAGNRGGLHGYDMYFAHDVPNMVEQYVRDGRFELAENIMNSGYYQRLYKEHLGNLDAIPKFIIPYATLWQAADDTERSAYFTDSVKNGIKASAKAIEAEMQGPNGILNKSESLDNTPYDYLVVDDFTALHGFAAYEYLCGEWGWEDESKWARTQMEKLNTALNTMLNESMTRRDTDWYMCAMNDDSGFWTRHLSGRVIYDGNWLGSTFMMSTFPWDAVLKGFDLGGTWAEYLDRSLDNAIKLKESRGDIPADSWGAWWGHEYGTVYNVGQCVPLLYSEKYRTRIVAAYEWLLNNQTAPFQWAESFDKGQNDDDWTKAAIDYETWGLGFLRQGLLEAFASVKTNGDVIIGRGIPDEWTFSDTPLEWKNININSGKHFDDMKISSSADKKSITVSLTGDDANGNIIINLPAMKGNINSVITENADDIIETDNSTGSVIVKGNVKNITINLKD